MCEITEIFLYYIESLKSSLFSFYLQRLLERSDHDQDGHLNFADFLRYVTEHEKHLRLSFHMLDHNKDGKYSYLFIAIELDTNHK